MYIYIYIYRHHIRDTANIIMYSTTFPCLCNKLSISIDISRTTWATRPDSPSQGAPHHINLGEEMMPNMRFEHVLTCCNESFSILFNMIHIYSTLNRLYNDFDVISYV